DLRTTAADEAESSIRDHIKQRRLRRYVFEQPGSARTVINRPTRELSGFHQISPTIPRCGALNAQSN
ncbi:hypothetical protein, partial [Nocardia fluminea]|uniref:hypothetical protein n=1 Tax=Nocardia fluminea TaxID=134984 RepID=UPI0033F3E256